METEQSDHKLSEKEFYQEKISQLKTINLMNPDYFQIGNYIDVMDDSRNWCVGQILDRLGDTITVHYEGCHTKSDETFSLKRFNKYNQFRRHSRGYSGLKKSAVRNYNFNLDDVKEIEKEIKNLTETKFNNVSDPLYFTQLFRGRIFTFIDIFMTTVYNSKEQSVAIPAVHSLLMEYIRMSVEYFTYYKQNIHIVNNFLIKNKDLYLIDPKCALLASIYEVILTLKRILGEDPRVSEFYKTNEDAIKKLFKQPGLSMQGNKTKICIEKAYKANSEYNKLPAVIVATMIDYFYEMGGFSSMWKILLPEKVFSNTDPNQVHVHFDVLEMILNFFQLYKIIVEFRNVFGEEVSQFKTYFTARIMNITEQEIKEVRKGIIVSSIKSLSFLIQFDSKVQKFFFEELYLTYHYKCVISKNLEKRIAGITAINLIIDTIERREMSRVDSYVIPSIGNKIEMDENIEMTDSKALIGFFKEKNFMDAILGENIHEEILKRGINFFRLLAKKSSNTNQFLLNESVYDLMWKNYEEKHESIAIQIENIICELSFYISEKDKLYLFNKIRSYTDKISSYANFDSNFFSMIRKTINFIRKFSENCLNKHTNNSNNQNLNTIDINDEKLYGLSLLWKYMQDATFILDTSTDMMLIDNMFSTQDTARKVEIIELSSQSILSLLTMDTLSDSIKEKFLYLCFDNLKSNVSVVQSLNLIRNILQLFPNYKSKKCVKYLDEKYSIMALIVSNLEKYVSKIRESGNTTVLDSSRSLDSIYEGYYTHRTNLEARLDLLYSFCNELRDRGKIPLTNESMLQLWTVLEINSGDVSEKDLFFESIHKNCDNFDNTLCEFIFIKIFLNETHFNWSDFNLTSFNLFEKLFYTVNTSNRKMINDGRAYRIQLDDIIGLDQLYQILSKVEDITVRNKLANLLSQLFTEFKIYNEDFCNRFWSTNIEKVLEILAINYEAKNKKAIKGIILFIKSLIKEIGNNGEIPQQDDVSFPRDGIEYSFVYPDKNESRTIRVGKNEYTSDVRIRIAYFFDIPINCLKLRQRQRLVELNDDFKLFVDVCQNNSSVEVKEGSHPILNFKNNPKNFLMRDTKLNKILYELLHDSHSSYIQDVWELVNLLPKNEAIEEEINQIGKIAEMNSVTDFKKYFDDQSIYVMSYSLKMVKSFIFTYEKSTNSHINKEWIVNFTNNKGASHLTKLIFQFKIDHFKFDLGYECLSDLLYILKTINEVTNCLEKETDSLIVKMFQIIHFVILSSIEKDNDEKLKKMQDSFTKQKERDLFKNSSGNDQMNNALSNQNCLDDEEICVEILKIYNKEDEVIRNLVSFIDDIAGQYKDTKSVYKILLDSSKDVIKEIVTKGLIIPKNYKFKITLKKFFKQLLDLLSFEEEDLAKVFKSTLFEFMLDKVTLSLADSYKETCSYFFKILSALLEEYLEPSAINMGSIKVDFNSLVGFLIDYIINKQIGEEDSEFEGNALEGHLQILRVLIIKSRELSELLIKNFNIIDLILNKCLLSKCQAKSSTSLIAKCTTSSSRESAYRLLASLSYNNPDITMEIVNVLNNYHMLGYWKSKRLFDWKISLSHDEKSSTGYVGLKNLGCTCYMNSLLQQFFMIPSLRESLLAAPDNSTSDVNKQDSSCLYQLKNIFASLKVYDGQYYNPKDFCMNFDGIVLDIREQMDVDEFFNTLIDKLENHTKGTSFQNLFKHFFGFTISDEFICKGCPHYSENEQYFNSIQLQVLNKKSIGESLKSYVEGELLEGDNAYYCDKCDKKVNTLKRQCIKKLPKMLIVVLKRFEFDYENMIKIKVNDYFEFPHELNMEPYTQEYLEKIEKGNKNESNSMENSAVSNPNEKSDEMKTDEDEIIEKTDVEENNQESSKNKKASDMKSINSIKPNNYYNYKLSGVVIHSGTSENGHYYSIIKDHTKQNWYEFNDTNVKKYDISDLPNEAFGGTETVTKDNKKETVEKTTNAYLLFYKREYEEVEESESIDKIQNLESNHSEAESDNKSSEIKQTVITKWDKYSNISPTIMDRIDLDNFQYWISKIIFSTEYHSFITDILINSNPCDIAMYNYSTKNDNKEQSSNMRKTSLIQDKTEIEMQIISADSIANKPNTQLLNLNVNSKMILNSNFYNKNDFVFVANQENEFTLFKFACLFYLNVLIRASDRDYMPSIMDWLKAMINKNHLYANWLLEEFSNNELILEYLIEPPLVEIKKLIVGLLYSAMISSYKSNEFENNSSLINFIGNIVSFMVKINDQDLTYIFYIIYRFALLGENSKVFLVQNGFLHFLTYYYLNKTTSNNFNSAICFYNPINAIGYIKLVDYTVSNHKELDQKLMNRIEKLTAWEELSEKKFSEKFSVQRNEFYLLMIFSDLVVASNINVKNNSVSVKLNKIKLDSEITQALQFNNPDLVRCLLNEAKSKQAAIRLSKLFANVCMNNSENTNIIQQVILDTLNTMDVGEFENILIILKRFILDIDDSLREARVNYKYVYLII